MLDLHLIQPYHALIFDMDGTLIDTMPAHAYAWQLTGEHFNYPFNSQIMYDLGGAPVTVIAKQIMQEAGMPLSRLDEVIQRKRQLSYELLPQKATLLPTFELVKTYYQHKPLTIGSGSHRKMIDLLMDKFDIAHYFNGIVSADDVNEHKPHPETFLRCAEISQAEPRQCLVFEDADLGVQAALAAGMDVFDVRIQQIIKA